MAFVFSFRVQNNIDFGPPRRGQISFYIQCKYGSKVLSLGKDGNALFVKQVADVKDALEAMQSAAMNGELDNVLDAAIKPRKASFRSIDLGQ
jgi:hypothetical protein